MHYYDESIELHKKLQGKIEVTSKVEVNDKEDLSIVYSPGVAAPCKAIAENPDDVWKYTLKANTVAVVSDGSAVLGLGNIGARASIPVMEGKAVLFKKFAGINAFPICIDSQDTEKIIETIRLIAPVFGGINLEDISAPRSFEIEERLQDLDIPVFHDDQHGTAVVVLAAIINSAKLVGKELKDLKVVINGSGAAGIAVSKLLRCVEHQNNTACISVKEDILCDSKGVIHSQRNDLNKYKRQVLSYSNPNNTMGSLRDALKDADVFVGVSTGDLLTADDIRTMADNAIVLALANPIPEIMPDEAIKGGAAVVGTGRSDLPNQVNNVLGFPGIFRGALDAKARSITPEMKLAAAYAIAESVKDISPEKVIPATLNMEVANNVAKAVAEAASEKSYT